MTRTKSKRHFPLLLIATAVLMYTANVNAQTPTDIAAVNSLLDRYRQTQVDGDIIAQSELMAKDRVWVQQEAGRRVDNVENMRIQLAFEEHRKKILPGLQKYIEDRERMIEFLADGKVAVVTFMRYARMIYPPGTSDELKRAHAPYSEWITLVLEKRGGNWLIVATHV